MGGVSQVKAALSTIGRYRGVSQLYCRKSRLNGPLRLSFPRIQGFCREFFSGDPRLFFFRGGGGAALNGQEDVNGEKRTVKKWWIFGADFFTVWCRFFHGLRRFFTVCKGHKR